ncbi:MAG: hypothetical protein VX899_12140 [Myxococcota bacterium]|nr:hypothetical protein [Myxococcota bacterium]
MSQVLFVLLTACAPEGESLDTGWSLDASVKEDVQVPYECPSTNYEGGLAHAEQRFDTLFGTYTKDEAYKMAGDAALAQAASTAASGGSCEEPCTPRYSYPSCYYTGWGELTVSYLERRPVPAPCYACAVEWEWVTVTKVVGVWVDAYCETTLTCSED